MGLLSILGSALACLFLRTWRMVSKLGTSGSGAAQGRHLESLNLSLFRWWRHGVAVPWARSKLELSR
uniref:Putative secreted protein n=1 Tax=Ixodes ricinus TaxID=34613 RepID=A0A6B0TQK9_IXORI